MKIVRFERFPSVASKIEFWVLFWEVVIFHVFGPSEFSKFDFRCNSEALRRFVYRRLSAFEFRVSISECVLGGPGAGFSGSFLGPDRSLFQDTEKSPGASYISI